jgi:hypothetical protein
MGVNQFTIYTEEEFVERFLDSRLRKNVIDSEMGPED